MRVKRSVVSIRVQTPDFVHKLLTGKNFVGIGQQLEKQLKFLQRQFCFLLFDGNAHSFKVQNGRADGYFFIRVDFRPAQQCFYAEQQFVDVDRLNHIVVRTQRKAALQRFIVVAGGNDENRRVYAGSPQFFGELQAVHIRHHDIGNNQIEKGFFEPCQSLVSVGRRIRTVSFARQSVAKQLS